MRITKINAAMIATILAFAGAQMAAAAERNAVASKKLTSSQRRKLVDVGKRALADRLKDPESARYRDLALMEEIGSPSPSRAVCGLFNAKNSYGGYGDEELFFVLLSNSGAVERVWLKDETPPPREAVEGDLSYINRTLRYRQDQNQDYVEHCDPSKGKVSMVWKPETR